MTATLWVQARYCAHLTLLVAGCALGASAVAADWQQSISVPMTLESDSNPTLAPGNGAKIKRTRIAPDYRLTGAFGLDEIAAGLALQIERSSDKNISQPRQDPTLYLNWRRLTQTGEFGLATKYQEASTRTSELNESGLTVRDGTRKTQSLGGNWRSTISERSSLAASADLTTVAYDMGTLTGYSNTSLSLSYNFAWSERIEPFLRLAVSHYVPDGTAGFSSDNRSLTGGLRVIANENMEWTAQLGRSRLTSPTNPANHASTSGLEGSFAFRRTGQSHVATIEFSRSVGASGTGGYIESDQLKASWSYTIGARNQVGLDASRRNTKNLLPNTMNQLSAWATHELSSLWSARLSGQYMQLEQSAQPHLSSAVFGLSLIYTHPNF
jgi:hypothetical protein